MQTIFQVLIGMSPLVLVCAFLLVKKSLRILPIVTLAGCLVVGIISAFTLKDEVRDVVTERKEAAASDYTYLANKALSEKDGLSAKKFAAKINEKTGDSEDATLVYARAAVMDGDYVGAKILYAKYLAEKNLSGSDKEIYDAICSGAAINSIVASSELSVIKNIEDAGYKPEDYGYSKEDIEKLENAVNAGDKYSELAANASEEDVKLAANQNKEKYESLAEAQEIIPSVEAMYEDYCENNSRVDLIKINNVYKKLTKLYDEAPSIFVMDEIDSAYVKTLVMHNEGKKLSEYAVKTDSQLAYVTLAQLLIDGQISTKDMPKEFVSLSDKERKRIAKECQKIYDEMVKGDKLDSFDQIELDERLALIKNLADNPVYTELKNRINPETEDKKNQSGLFLGASALYYKVGDDNGGNSMLDKAVNSAEYSDNPTYSNAVKKLNGLLHDAVESDEIKNVSDYIKDAYNSGVVHTNPNVSNRVDEFKKQEDDADEPDDEPENDPSSSYPGPFFPGHDDEDDDQNDNQSAIDILASQGTIFVTTQSAKINISKLDTSKFPEVKTTIATSSPLDLKNLQLEITDAGQAIEDFTIEKVDYSSAKIFMVCDKSGSMSGNDRLLKEAVRQFASSITKGEQIALVGFSDRVEFASDLTSNLEELEVYIERLSADGGTNIADGAFYAVNALEGSKDSLNVVVVMTDGEDSTFGATELRRLKNMCDENGIVLYTIGLGSAVYTDYLREIAEYGNGSFMYCNDGSELLGLYSFIHAQANNTYNITFKAVDTTTNKRVLNITNKADGSFAKKTYYLQPENYEEKPVDDGEFTEITGDVRVDGFDTKKIYKKDSDALAMISGKNFTADMKAIVNITGDAYKDSLTATFSSDTKFEVTIPKAVPAGKYSVEITIGGYTMQDEIEVLLPGKALSLQYGAYTFTAQSIEESEYETVLSGDVCLNGFIHFKGDVRLYGDVKNDLQIRLNDDFGSYITFTSKLPGLLGSTYGQTMTIGRLGELIIYNDKFHLNDLDEYMVETISIPFFEYAAFNNVAATIGLYPHKISVKIESMSFEFPSLDSILTPKDGKNGLDFLDGGDDNNVEGIINGSGLYIKGKIGTEGSSTSKGLGSMNLKLGELSLEFDTFKHDYEFTCKVNTSIVPSKSSGDEGAYGFDIGFKGGKWDSVTLYADFPITVCPEPPISLSDFSAGVKDMASVDQNANFAEQFFSYTFKGGCDVSVCKIADICPPLKVVTGDVSLLTLDDTTLEFSILNWKYELSTKLKVLGVIDYGGVKVKLGKYDFEDFLLGVNGDEVYGLSIEANNGPDISFANIQASCQGTDKIDVNNKGFALKKAGDVEFDINLIKHFKNHFNGTFEIAAYEGKGYIIARASSKEKAAGFKVCLDGWHSYIEL